MYDWEDSILLVILAPFVILFAFTYIGVKSAVEAFSHIGCGAKGCLECRR